MVENFENMSKEKLVFMLKEYQNKVQSLQTEVDFYKGQFALANKKRFGRTSEKTDNQQLNFWSQLFNEPETIVEIAGKVVEEENEPKKKVKKGPNKNHMTRGVVAKEMDVHHDLDEDKKKCENCGETLRCIGKELAYVEMVYHPGYYEKINHFQSAYVCPNNCIEESDGPQGETAVIKSNLPNKLLPKSSASPSLLAKIIYDKFEKSLPLYRQEKEYMNVGFDLTRQTMSNWILKVDELYISHLIRYMKKQLDRSHLVLLDETRVEVINHPEKQASAANAYMWVARTGPYEPNPIVIFEYKRGRDHQYAYEITENCDAIIQSDGYEAYDKLPNIHLGCFAHLRRK
ncbi:MAG: transposase, partial [Floccifex sp.]